MAILKSAKKADFKGTFHLQPQQYYQSSLKHCTSQFHCIELSQQEAFLPPKEAFFPPNLFHPNCRSQIFLIKLYYFTFDPIYCRNIKYNMSRATSKTLLLQNFPKDKMGKEPEFQCVIALSAAFLKEIEEPIALRETIMKRSDLQRCLSHNITYSIYCTVCRKVLCASCMYTANLHRKHRVVPIQTAIELIREDLHTFQSKIPKILHQFDSVTISNNEYLVRMEKDISPVITKLQQFYEELRSFIKIKEKEQLAAIKEKRDQIRAEVNAYNKEITRLHQYIQEKSKSYANTNIQSELLIPSRVILENLMQAGQFLNELPTANEKIKFTSDPEKIKDTMHEIQFKINQLVIFPVTAKITQTVPTVSTPRSVSKKSKTNPFTPKVVVNDEPILLQKRKRVNSSIAGARTFRQT